MNASQLRFCLLGLFALLAIGNTSFGGEPGHCLDQDAAYLTTDAPRGDAPFFVQSCDLNGDGYPDLVTANDGSDTVSVLLNDGSGAFGRLRRWSVGPDAQTVYEPVSVDCCDFDGDGSVDLITANHSSDDVSILWNAGTVEDIPQFAETTQHPVGEAPWSVRCAPIDPDQHPDLAVAAFTSDSVSILRNDGEGGVSPGSYEVGVGDGPRSLALCDLDGDGDLDVLTANVSGQSASILRNDGKPGLTPLGQVALGRNPFAIACCDLDGNPGPEIVTANIIDDSVVVLFNDGGGAFDGLTLYQGLDGATSVACGDVTGDGVRDVITANLSGDDVAVLANQGDGVLSPPEFLLSGASPSGVVLTAIDGTARRDLAVSASDGVTTFINGCPLPGDADGDGDLDLMDAGGLADCIDLQPLAAECLVFDFDGDSAVTLEDARRFSGGMTGP